MMVGLVDVTTQNCMLKNNTAAEKGTVYVSGPSSLSDVSSEFQGNNANIAGAVYQLGPAVFNFTAFNGNSAAFGAALFLSNWTDATNPSRCSPYCSVALNGVTFNNNVRGAAAPRPSVPAAWGLGFTHALECPCLPDTSVFEL